MLVAATDLPINANLEAGFADGPEGVARNVALAVQTGVAGLSIEDRTGGDLYELSLAVERRRVSTGGALARTAMAAAESEARGLLAEEAAVSAHPRV